MTDEKTTDKPATETRAAKSGKDNKTETSQAVATDTDVAANAPKDGKIVRAEREENDTELPELGDADTAMVVEENVYQEFYPPNTKRPSYRLLFHKGQVVMKSQYDAAVNG